MFLLKEDLQAVQNLTSETLYLVAPPEIESGCSYERKILNFLRIPFSPWSRASICSPGQNRTDTPVREKDFKSFAASFTPLGHTSNYHLSTELAVI